MVKVIILGTSNKIFEDELKGFNYSFIDKKKRFVRINDDYIFTHFFGSGVFPSKYLDLKNCDEIIFLGMAYGFNGININDYCLPDEFASVKFGWTDRLSMALFKERELKEEFIFDDTTDVLKINNILGDNKFKGVINRSVNNSGKRVITSPFSLFTPYNTVKLQNKGFNLGEMESYNVALMAKKRGIPFGCLLVCTDNLEHDVRDGIKGHWSEIKRVIDDSNVSDSDKSNIKKLLLSEKLTDFEKIKSLLKEKYPEFYEPIKKQQFKNKSDGNIFQAKIKELYRLMRKIITEDL